MLGRASLGQRSLGQTKTISVNIGVDNAFFLILCFSVPPVPTLGANNIHHSLACFRSFSFAMFLWVSVHDLWFTAAQPSILLPIYHEFVSPILTYQGNPS
eukprot:gene10136-7094_t